MAGSSSVLPVLYFDTHDLVSQAAKKYTRGLIVGQIHKIHSHILPTPPQNFMGGGK